MVVLCAKCKILCVCVCSVTVNDVNIFIMSRCEDKKMWRCQHSTCKTCLISSSDTRFLTQKPLHTDAFTDGRNLHTCRHFYTQKLLHSEASRLYTQTPLHTDACHTSVFTRKLLRLYTHTYTHTHTLTNTQLLKCLVELWCGMQRSCKNSDSQKHDKMRNTYNYTGDNDNIKQQR